MPFPHGSRHIWESNADGNFAVTEDTENEPLGRGTEIRIYLKSDAAEYAQEDKLRVRKQTCLSNRLLCRDSELGSQVKLVVCKGFIDSSILTVFNGTRLHRTSHLIWDN